MAIGGRVGRIEKVRLCRFMLRLDKFNTFVGKEIHRVAGLVIDHDVVENIVAIETAYVTIFECDPVVEPLCGEVGSPKWCLPTCAVA